MTNSTTLSFTLEGSPGISGSGSITGYDTYLDSDFGRSIFQATGGSVSLSSAPDSHSGEFIFYDVSDLEPENWGYQGYDPFYGYPAGSGYGWNNKYNNDYLWEDNAPGVIFADNTSSRIIGIWSNGDSMILSLYDRVANSWNDYILSSFSPDENLPTPPTLQSTTATSNQLFLTFSEDIQIAGGVLNPSFFTVTVDGRRLAVAGATINPNDPKQIILAIAGNRGRGLSGESTINIAYNPPTTPNQAGVLQGINGALLQSFAPTSPDTFTSEQSISRRGLSSNFKNLILTGSAIDAIGNDQDNTITGNDANNILNGLAGADTMIGKGGNDTYVVDNAGDVITELANEGVDTVESIISYALGDNLENLTLTDRSANINGTGNAMSNVITGNRGDNILDGNGGADTLIGDRGNDTYIVDSLDDIIVESGASREIDSVQSSISWMLGVNLENLTLTGTSAINATGNTLDNILIGNDAANVIDGGNGGKDILTGLGGADTFRLSAKPRRFTGAYVNRITDFSSAQGDKIQISKSAFGITASTATLSVVSSAAALTTALSTASLFVYNTANGELHWNQNGITRGAGSGGVLAILDNKATLSAGDLILV